MFKTFDLLTLPYIFLSEKDKLPKCSAIYFAVSAENRVLYVGKAENLLRRWSNHHRFEQLNQCQSLVKLAWLQCPKETLSEFEKHFIRFYVPLYNGTPRAWEIGKDSNLIDPEPQHLANRIDLGEVYKHFKNSLLEGGFWQANETRNSLVIKDGNKVILMLKPEESDSDSGLKCIMYTTKFSSCFGINKTKAISLLPENKGEWKNTPTATPDWCGDVGFFRSIEEVKHFITGLRQVKTK